jgi:hypothetical protein
MTLMTTSLNCPDHLVVGRFTQRSDRRRRTERAVWEANFEKPCYGSVGLPFLRRKDLGGVVYSTGELV